MKRYFLVLLFALVFGVFSGSINASAQSATSTPAQINARIMPLVWYSTLSINEGDSIKIYAGIQNNSGLNFTGNAVFYVDDEEIAKRPFISENDTLIDVSANWVANLGSHNVQVKLTTSITPDKELVSAESDKSKVSITRKITVEMVQEITRNTVDNIVNQIDEIASSSANKVETFKKPVSTDSAKTSNSYLDNSKPSKLVSSLIQKPKGDVLGTSTKSAYISDKEGVSWWTYIYNWLIDALVFLIRHWLGVLIGLVVMYFGWKVMKWGSK